MILYNTLMGVCAGLALILVPKLINKLYRGTAVAAEGWSVTFGILGVILTFLSALMATTWPLTVNPPINIMFSEPNLVLGVLLLAASFLLWKQRDAIRTLSESKGQARTAAEVQLARTLVPITWIIFGLGLMLAACTAAILRFGIVGGAPEAEPITGLLYNHPAIENTFFAILYGLSAIGALLAPFALRHRGAYWAIMSRIWLIAGVCFLLFSAMNYYTHIGLLWNINHDTHYRF
jgi:hypothetical protein